MIWKPGHYKLVASVLAARMRANHDYSEEAIASWGEDEILARAFADAFQAKDKKFRRDKFLEACGLRGEAGR
jgi:hypothetical protein